jgi:hypothetical protein
MLICRINIHIIKKTTIALSDAKKEACIHLNAAPPLHNAGQNHKIIIASKYVENVAEFQ